MKEVDEFDNTTIHGWRKKVLVQLILKQFHYFFREKNDKGNIAFDISVFNDKTAKENFIKTSSNKQVESSKVLCAVSPNEPILKQHCILLEAAANSNFRVLLAEIPDGAVTVDQFATTFSHVLAEKFYDFFI